MTNALRGMGCITLPQPYDALPLLLRIVLKQTGNTFLDISDDELWEATVDWDDREAIHRLTQEYQQALPWLETIRQFDLFYQREPTTIRRTILGNHSLYVSVIGNPINTDTIIGRNVLNHMIITLNGLAETVELAPA